MFDEAARIRPEHWRSAWITTGITFVIGAGLLVARFALFPRIGGALGSAITGACAGLAVYGSFALIRLSRAAKSRLSLLDGRIVRSSSERETLSVPLSAVTGTIHVRKGNFEGIGLILVEGAESQVSTTPKIGAPAMRATHRNCGCHVVIEGFDEDAHRRFAAALRPPA